MHFGQVTAFLTEAGHRRSVRAGTNLYAEPVRLGRHLRKPRETVPSPAFMRRLKETWLDWASLWERSAGIGRIAG